MELKTIQDVSDEIERCAKYLEKQLINLTKKNISLMIVKEKNIITDLRIETKS